MVYIRGVTSPVSILWIVRTLMLHFSTNSSCVSPLAFRNSEIFFPSSGCFMFDVFDLRNLTASAYIRSRNGNELHTTFTRHLCSWQTINELEVKVHSRWSIVHCLGNGTSFGAVLSISMGVEVLLGQAYHLLKNDKLWTIDYQPSTQPPVRRQSCNTYP